MIPKVFAVPVPLVALLVAGCSLSPPPNPAMQATFAPEFSTSARAFYSGVGATLTALRGTPAQQARASVRSVARFEQAKLACMRRAGFRYDVQTLPLHVYPVNYDPNWWATPSRESARLGLGYATDYVPHTPGRTSPYDGTPAKAAYLTAFAACDQAVGSGPEFATQPKAAALTTSLLQALDTVAASQAFAPVRARYAACMTGRGVDVAQPSDLPDVVEAKIGQILNPVDPRSAQYAALVPRAKKVEAALTDADAGCRAELSDDVVRLLSPAYTAWITPNPQALREASARWQSAS